MIDPYTQAWFPMQFQTAILKAKADYEKAQKETDMYFADKKIADRTAEILGERHERLYKNI